MLKKKQWIAYKKLGFVVMMGNILNITGQSNI